MKKILIAALFALCAAPAGAAVTGCLYELRGQVAVQKAGADWRQALKGEALAEGDRVRTGADGWGELLLKDGTYVKIESGSEASIDSLQSTAEDRTFAFSFIKGKALWMAAKFKNRLGSKFLVRTPTAVCAVRGTDFVTLVSSAGVTELGLFEGEVAVTGGSAEKTLLPGGQLTAAAGGLTAKDKFTPEMRAEERRYLKLKARVEGLRQRLAAREDFIEDYVNRQNKALAERDLRLKERLEKLGPAAPVKPAP